MIRAWVLVTLCLSTAGQTWAADKISTAREHFEHGSALFDLGSYAEAAHEYESAYKIKPDPALLFNIGQAYRLANDHASALRAYKSYLRRVPNPGNRGEVERHINTLTRLLDEQKQASQSPPTGTIVPDSMKRPAPAAEPKIEPIAPPAPVPALLSTATQDAPRRTPTYKKWWVWTIAAGAVVVVGAGVGLAVAYTTPNNASAPAGAREVTFP